MGFPKYMEDNDDRYVESGPLELPGSIGSKREPEPRRPQLRYCPLCFEGYLKETDLGDHVARSHGKQHVYLKVNGWIVRDVCWLKQPIRECDLVLLQVPSLDVVIRTDRGEKQLTIHEPTSLMGSIREKSRGVICIRTLGGRFSREFTIYLGRQPKFETIHLDAALLDLMGRLNQQHREDMGAFRDKCRKKRLNALEARYMDGVVEYCHGWQLEIEDSCSLARGHLEAAMDLLNPFQTALAVDLRCALALKMNCFAGQWGCEQGSAFQLAEHFFCRDARTRAGLEGALRETMVPLASNSRIILEALKAYYANNVAGVFDALNMLRATRTASAHQFP